MKSVFDFKICSRCGSDKSVHGYIMEDDEEKAWPMPVVSVEMGNAIVDMMQEGGFITSQEELATLKLTIKKSGLPETTNLKKVIMAVVQGVESANMIIVQ